MAYIYAKDLKSGQVYYDSLLNRYVLILDVQPIKNSLNVEIKWLFGKQTRTWDQQIKSQILGLADLWGNLDEITGSVVIPQSLLPLPTLASIVASNTTNSGNFIPSSQGYSIQPLPSPVPLTGTLGSTQVPSGPQGQDFRVKDLNLGDILKTPVGNVWIVGTRSLPNNDVDLEWYETMTTGSWVYHHVSHPPTTIFINNSVRINQNTLPSNLLPLPGIQPQQPNPSLSIQVSGQIYAKDIKAKTWYINKLGDYYYIEKVDQTVNSFRIKAYHLNSAENIWKDFDFYYTENETFGFTELTELPTFRVAPTFPYVPPGLKSKSEPKIKVKGKVIEGNKKSKVCVECSGYTKEVLLFTGSCNYCPVCE
jgi:hypothetical protein